MDNFINVIPSINNETETVRLEFPDFVWEKLKKISKARGMPVNALLEEIVVKKYAEFFKDYPTSS